MADKPKGGYLGPRPVEGYDSAIDRMSNRIDELEAEIVRLRGENATLRKNEWRLVWGLCTECGRNRDQEARRE